MGTGAMHRLAPMEVRDIYREAGTMLGTSRTNPGRDPADLGIVVGNLQAHAIDGLIAIGGDDTLSVAAKLHEAGVRVVGIPKTIDNDVPETDFCIGFDTATGVIVDGLERLFSTAKSHGRIMFMEVMGREAGWLAIVGGLAGGADFIAIPEEPVHIDQIVDHARHRKETSGFSLMVVAEGMELEGMELPAGDVDGSDQFGHVRLVERGIAQHIADEVKRRTGFDTRVTVLGHLQRGGSPSVRDRYCSMLIGSAAVDFLHRDLSGNMTALQGSKNRAGPLVADSRQDAPRSA